ncbi:MAG: DUF732 domain-containing protein [Mycobacteriales bacterium]
MTIQHTRTAIASGTCLTLGVAVAVALGAVPRVTGTDGAATSVVRAAASRPSVTHFAPSHSGHLVTHHATAHVRVAAPAATSAPVAGTATVPSPVSDLLSGLTVQPAAAAAAPASAANIRTHHHHHHRHHHKKKHHKQSSKPTLAPRTTPSASAVSSAIAGLRQYVNSPFTPTAKQVAQFGNDVCTAFDQGHTYSAVISEVEQKVHQIPFTSLKSGGADYVVKTAVSLYCPGYSSKVS